ncbi:hypothetical protein BS47DRAFT_1486653 [Hydnum rufescens UP504]|uniref:Uncharacterized protein n=1 Tax=Hydnum rufescens UP504 TaxID=1448309 RepID=A0A9P6AUC7_9AGAM|nr:hypothetical protein BS47DRAFT_1486653 [Hydnum rufescens UP504]
MLYVAEEAVRQYIKKCNRPYGAGAFAIRVLSNSLHFPWTYPHGADVSANIKKAGPKLATQKILLALTEKSEITQKSYGAFVSSHSFTLPSGACLRLILLATLECKQSDEDDTPTEKADELQKEVDQSKEENKGLTTSNRLLTKDMPSILVQTFLPGSLVSTVLRTNSLPALISTLRSSLEGLDGVLAPYRISFADAPIPETKDVGRLDADWARWREPWKKRKKIFKELHCFIRITPRAFVVLMLDMIWSSITEHLSLPDASELAESLGIGFDSEEHEALERGPLCQPPARHRAGTTGKTTKH